jgi:transposase-like protein
LQAVVADDNINIFEAAKHVYPNVVIQLCQNHYKENIRATLSVRTDETYTSFMREIEELFSQRYSKEQFDQMASKIYRNYPDFRCQAIMLDIEKRKKELCGYMADKHIPRTTNLIESFNSHLQGRLKTIKGFESFTGANHWLNAYFLKRRLTKFTDCTRKFRTLNGKRSLELTLKDSKNIHEALRLLK